MTVPAIFACCLRIRSLKTAPLLELLTHFDNHECEDARDRVFALINLPIRQDKLHVEPDYTKSVSEVYTSLAAKYLFLEPGDGLVSLYSQAFTVSPSSAMPSPDDQFSTQICLRGYRIGGCHERILPKNTLGKKLSRYLGRAGGP